MTVALGGEAPGLLRGVRVLDLTELRAEAGPRLLADLGADVIRIEPPGGSATRTVEGDSNLTGIRHAIRNANKRGIVLDITADEGRQQFLRLVDSADIVFEDSEPGWLERWGLAPEDLLARRPELVVVSVTAFGRSGPRREWVGTEWVHLAMGAVLARSGLPDLPPLMPPASLAYETAASDAVWSGLLAYVNRLVTGAGDCVDVSVHESLAQILDPGFGVGGGALAGASPADGPRGRPDAAHLYPIFPCADGFVRFCILSAKQWHGVRALLGEPAEFADPELDRLLARYAVRERLYPAIAEACATRTRAELVELGVRNAVPIAGVATLSEVLASEHFVERGTINQLPLADGRVVSVPDGVVEVNGERVGYRTPAPTLGEHDGSVLDGSVPDRSRAPRRPTWSPGASGRPLDGLRVLDLGVIIVGAETGRLLADFGAEVIKVENSSFPDGARQSFAGEEMSMSFARGNRGKLSLGLNLRTAKGRELFLRLVAESDVVLSNFRPGTLESLGLGHTELAAANPRIVTLSSSAWGATGPWSRRMGYGPLVRAGIGVTGLWCYPDAPGLFSDAATAYPDHLVGRVGAAAVLAGLISLRADGRDVELRTSQAEIALGQLAEAFARESLDPGSVGPAGNTRPGDAPRAVYPCAGDDEWCAVDIRGDADWIRLCEIVGRPDLSTDPRFADPHLRERHSGEIDVIVGAWTSKRAPQEVMEALQTAGVPAGMMQRYSDLRTDAQLMARGYFATLSQPQVGVPLTVDRGAAVFGSVAAAVPRPSPAYAEHSVEVCRRVLGMTDAEIAELVASGDLEVVSPQLSAGIGEAAVGR